jgi:ceramide glucosyltransferase
MAAGAMLSGYLLGQSLVLLPVVGGSLYGLLGVVTAVVFCARQRELTAGQADPLPPVTVLKPIHGLEKNLAANLASVCSQDYPDYQVVLSVQRRNDPALPLLKEIQRQFGPHRVELVVVDSEPMVNGKVQNLLNALPAARHEVLIISDSDVMLRRDYLKTMVAPLGDPKVGYVCTLYRATRAERWFERLELLTLNADFTPSVIFAEITGMSDFCTGASIALRRATLDSIGGLQPLREYLVEDYEMGRRIQSQGLQRVLVPYFVDLIVDLPSPGVWWHHQLYWDQHIRAARPGGFFATVLMRALPFALLFALLRLDLEGLGVLAAALVIRLATVGFMLAYVIKDREGLGSLAWLPLRDLLGLASWWVALFKRSFVWRGLEFQLTRAGKIVPRRVG